MLTSIQLGTDPAFDTTPEDRPWNQINRSRSETNICLSGLVQTDKTDISTRRQSHPFMEANPHVQFHTNVPNIVADEARSVVVCIRSTDADPTLASQGTWNIPINTGLKRINQAFFDAGRSNRAEARIDSRYNFRR
jgi:hypothetical protein